MKKRLFIIATLILFVLIQLIKTTPETNEIVPQNDFLTLTKAPPEIKQIINTSCYDCHSLQTNLPWYVTVAPLSWIINHHITEGRENVNFSTWGNYSPEEQQHLLAECQKEISKNKMPLSSYTLIHTQAKLTETSKKQLLEWLQAFQNQK